MQKAILSLSNGEQIEVEVEGCHEAGVLIYTTDFGAHSRAFSYKGLADRKPYSGERLPLFEEVAVAYISGRDERLETKFSAPKHFYTVVDKDGFITENGNPGAGMHLVDCEGYRPGVDIGVSREVYDLLDVVRDAVKKHPLVYGKDGGSFEMRVNALVYTDFVTHQNILPGSVSRREDIEQALKLVDKE